MHAVEVICNTCPEANPLLLIGCNHPLFFAEAIGEFGQVHTAHARVLRPFAILIPLVVIKACDQPALHAEPQSLKR